MISGIDKATVERWTVCANRMVRQYNGYWVRGDDYDDLAAHAEKLERENEALRGEKAGAKSVANEQFHRANRLERERDEALSRIEMAEAAALQPGEAQGAEPVASRVYVGGEASVAVCSFCDISGCHHIRATNTTPPAAQVTEALVERAFKAGLAYASICDVTDPDEAWRISNIRAAALRALAGEK